MSKNTDTKRSFFTSLFLGGIVILSLSLLAPISSSFAQERSEPVKLAVPQPECDDGVDNDDADELIDMNDPQCDSPGDDEGPPAKCSDGVDNDNDGWVDYSAFSGGDPDCDSESDDKERADTSGGGGGANLCGTQTFIADNDPGIDDERAYKGIASGPESQVDVRLMDVTEFVENGVTKVDDILFEIEGRDADNTFKSGTLDVNGVMGVTTVIDDEEIRLESTTDNNTHWEIELSLLGCDSSFVCSGTWQEVASIQNNISCTPPDDVTEDEGDGAQPLYSADGSAEKIKIASIAEAGYEDCNSNSCKASAYSNFDVTAFGDTTEFYAHASYKCDIGAGTCSSADDESGPDNKLDTETKVYGGFPNGDVDVNHIGYSQSCQADYGISSDTNYRVKVYECNPSGGNGDPDCSDDGPIDVDRCSDSSGKIIDVLANDSDPDNDDLEITSIVSQPSEGSVSIISGGNKVEYTPPSSYTGTTTFKYKVGDGNGGTDTAQVTINVTDDNCGSACSVTYQNDPIKTFTLEENDGDTGELHIEANTNTDPSNLDTTLSVYYINASQLDDDWPVKTALTITGNSGADSYEVVRTNLSNGNSFVEESGSSDPLDVDFRAADSNYPDGYQDDMTISYPSPSGGGTWNFNYTITAETTGDSPDGTPPQTKEWNVSLQCDGNGDPDCSDDGTNDDPICVDPSGPTTIDVFANDSDPDGDNLTITKIAGTPVSNGSAVTVGNGTVIASSTDAGTLVYTPTTNADESFTYTASDGNGNTDQATVYVDPNGCGQLTVQVEGPDGNLVPNATFAPKYDSDANGTTTAGEQLPEKGMSTGKFTYNVAVSDTPRLSKMNESLMQNIPAGYATSVAGMQKRVEKTAGGQNEPDDHWYQNVTNKKSKLAIDATSTDGVCDTGTCSWQDQTCGGSGGGKNCDPDQMLQQENCTDPDCTEGYRCVSDSSCGG